MQVLRETSEYQMVEDRHMGVVRVVRKSDNGLTDMMTGREAQFYKDEMLHLSDVGFNAEAEVLEYS